ncbi:phosphate ABC transporter permease subunit PstC [Carnobacterium sp.]|uniref:phosphate ABC transporter permease subunit PstC n=1 Tax=Carnobacterium sp. TaxID=48221 RepID=UPI003C70A599
MRNLDKFMQGVFMVSALLSVMAIILISVFVFAGGLPFIAEYGLGNFLLGEKWTPSNNPAAFGILPMIIGSVSVTLGAVVIGVPIGVLTAVFMAEYCPPKLYKILKPAVNLMAAIPSIVYGFFALQVIVPFMRNLFGGTGMNMITVMLLLSVMILPTIIGMSEAAIRSVPKSYYYGSLALGATHDRSVMKVSLLAAKSGIFSSIILGIGRAIGETMAVVLVAGNQPRIPDSLTQGVRTLTTNIVLEMSYATGRHREALIATAVVLFGFILLINGVFMLIKRKEVTK